MPNLLDIRRRIRSVRNTRQITRAMRMVSAAKLRRAQEQALGARPYAERLETMLAEMAARVDAGAVAAAAFGAGGAAELAAALLARRPERRVAMVVITADKGLAGAFNANALKAAFAWRNQWLGAHPDGVVEWVAVGRKGRDYLRRRFGSLAGERVGLFARRGVEFGAARELAAHLMRRYAAAEVDAVYLVGNEFKSVLQQRVELRRLLPVITEAATEAATTAGSGAGERLEKGSAAGGPAGESAAEGGAGSAGGVEAIFEPPPAELLAALLPRYVEARVYRALLESFAAEHAARMNAMDTASRNAGEMIDGLTLAMNRVRQAAITKEIIEVVSGASAAQGGAD